MIGYQKAGPDYIILANLHCAALLVSVALGHETSPIHTSTSQYSIALY